MGTILEAICPCGYHREELFVGGGAMEDRSAPAEPEVCAQPALCPCCRRLFVADYSASAGGVAGSQACPACGGKPYFYTEAALQGDPLPGHGGTARCPPDVFSWYLSGPEGDEEVRLPAVRYLCPAFGKKTLEFRESGCWE